MKATNRTHRDEVMINLGVVLRQLRMNKGYRSAELFSFEYELNRTAYWRWENGENITLKNLLRLCTIHKISPRELFELIDVKFPSRMNSGLLNEPEMPYEKKSRDN